MESREDTSDQSFDFPEEILLEILVRLPFKSVFRFKCVCKNWLSLISDAAFFRSFVSRSKETPPSMLVFGNDGYGEMYVFLSIGKFLKDCSSPFPYDQIPGIKAVAASNDLILYKSHRRESAYFLTNPFTRQCVRIPVCSRRGSYGYTGLITYVRNGMTSYNVVRLIKDPDGLYSAAAPFTLNLEIFSSEKGEWSSFKLRNRVFNEGYDARPCIVFKGILHWVCNKLTNLLAYDPCSGQCRFISIPKESYYMNGWNAILGISCEDLYYFEMSEISRHGNYFPAWRLWVLKDYETGEWRLDREGKERKIDALDDLGTFISTYSPLFPVSFHPWDKDIAYFWYEGYTLNFNIKEGWFEDNLSTFCMKSIVSSWDIFPLLMPFCPTQIPEPPQVVRQY